MSYINNKINIEEIIEKANLGDAEAQYSLGKAYLSGRHIERDCITAVKWLKSSAAQGNEDAMISLGMCYMRGNGVEKNVLEGIKLWTMAADLGNKKAMINLASLYYNGSYGFDVDYNEAFKWYTKADCKSGMGECYLYGYGVDQNYDEAFKCFVAADDKRMLGECYLHGWGVKRDVNKTIELWSDFAESYYSHGMYETLWHLLIDGIEMEPDYERGFYWLNYAAYADEGDPEGGDYNARYELARCYYEGKGTRKDVKRALKLFRSTIELFYRYDGSASVSAEPDRIINARRILVKHGYKSEINKLKKAAENGDAKAAEILREFEIDFDIPKPTPMVTVDVKEIPVAPAKPMREPLINIAVGDKVLHKTFGEGCVCESDDGYICVEFAAGKKKFLNPEAFNDGFLSRDI